jgi:TolA-binding protein
MDKFNEDITLDDLDLDFSFDSASFNDPTAELKKLSMDNGEKIEQLQEQIDYLEELIKMIFQKIVYPNHMPNKRKKQS